MTGQYFFFGVCLLILVFTTPASALTRYLEASGSDTGDCTSPSSPCLTLGYVAAFSSTDETWIFQGTGVWAHNNSLSLTGYTSLELRGNGRPNTIIENTRFDCDFAGSLRMERMEIKDRISGNNGGCLALSAQITTATLQTMEFTGCGGQDGGAVFSNAGQLIIDNSILDENLSSGCGGAVALGGAGGGMTMTSTRLKQNMANAPNDGGGAVCSAQGNVRFEGVSFIDNVASPGGRGGAVIVRAHGGPPEDDPVFVSCSFSQNEADIRGGAVHATEVGAYFEDCLFEENVSYEDGGGVDFAGPGQSFTILNSNFTGNSAVGSSSSARVWGGTMSLDGVRVEHGSSLISQVKFLVGSFGSIKDSFIGHSSGVQGAGCVFFQDSGPIQIEGTVIITNCTRSNDIFGNGVVVEGDSPYFVLNEGAILRVYNNSVSNVDCTDLADAQCVATGRCTDGYALFPGMDVVGAESVGNCICAHRASVVDGDCLCDDPSHVFYPISARCDVPGLEDGGEVDDSTTDGAEGASFPVVAVAIGISLMAVLVVGAGVARTQDKSADARSAKGVPGSSPPPPPPRSRSRGRKPSQTLGKTAPKKKPNYTTVPISDMMSTTTNLRSINSENAPFF